MSQSQARHKRKTLAGRIGEVVHTSRLLATGEWIGGAARITDVEIDVNGHVGRVILERIKFLHACARVGAYEMFGAAFHAAIDTPIKGFPGWWTISGHYALLNRYTSEEFMKRCMTRIVMDNGAV